jgi:macrolide transport system ATP-binding/permease protein
LFNLLPRTSALANVELPMIYAGTSNREARARQLLTDVGLEDRMGHRSNQLSGGQQQRVAIARALANHPRIIFADEPTGNLASDQAQDILKQLTHLHRAGLTIIMVTHEADIAAYAERAILLKGGRIVTDERTRPAGSAAQGAVLTRTGKERPMKTQLPPSSPGRLWGELREFGRSALRTMLAHKARSGLSALGILIGVASVIAMLALGRGAQQSVEARLASLGSNLVMVFNGAPSMRGIRGAADNYNRLTLEDAKAIRRETPQLTAMYPEAEGHVRVVYQNQNTVTELQGVTIAYESIRHAKPEYGRFFTNEENASLARVVLLGQTVVQNLFGTEYPVGKTVKINRVNFTVIGLLPSKGGSGFGDQDDMVVIPINTAMKRVLGTVYLHEMALECASPEAIPAVMEDVGRLLRHRHRIPALKEDDFTLRNNADVQTVLSSTSQTFSMLLGIVASISLLVGGVGIMNIMLVSVNERTREIGLRKAVGAAQRMILSQFLMEAAVLSIAGGIMGIALGMGVARVLSTWAGWETMVTPQAVLLAFSFSAGVGVLFGFWPARKASLLSPIEALRYE